MSLSCRWRCRDDEERAPPTTGMVAFCRFAAGALSDPRRRSRRPLPLSLTLLSPLLSSSLSSVGDYYSEAAASRATLAALDGFRRLSRSTPDPCPAAIIAAPSKNPDSRHLRTNAPSSTVTDHARLSRRPLRSLSGTKTGPPSSPAASWLTKMNRSCILAFSIYIRWQRTGGRTT